MNFQGLNSESNYYYYRNKISSVDKTFLDRFADAGTRRKAINVQYTKGNGEKQSFIFSMKAITNFYGAFGTKKYKGKIYVWGFKGSQRDKRYITCLRLDRVNSANISSLPDTSESLFYQFLRWFGYDPEEDYDDFYIEFVK